MDYLIFIVSLVALLKGANMLVVEAERFALKFGISEFVIGATLIALGTSLPEFATAVSATLNDKSDIAVSNVIGSVILNITLVLGFVFFVAKKINPKRDIFFKDAAWSLFPLFVFIMVSFDGNISRVEGVLFLLLIVGYLMFLSNTPEIIENEIDKEIKKDFNIIKSTVLFIIALILVVKGADYLVYSASNIASSLGVSEWIIGLFLIALGTSLPELMVSIVAAKKNKADMSIGNIIGSNIANFSVVLGGASIFKPLIVDIQKYSFDILTAIVVTLMLVFISANKLYNRSAAIALFVILGIFLNYHIQNFLN